MMKNTFKIVLFLLACLLVIIGQKNVGPMGLLTMLVGVVILMYLLYDYNKKYR